MLCNPVATSDAFGLFDRLPRELVTHHILPHVLAQGPQAVDAFSQTCAAAYHTAADAAQHTLVAWSKQTLDRNPLLRMAPPGPSQPPHPSKVVGALQYLKRISVQEPEVYGRAALKRGRYTEAAKYFKEALAYPKDHLGTHFLLLKALRGAGDTTQLAFWTRVALVPMCQQQEHASLLRFSLEAGVYDVALDTAEDFLTMAPKAKRAGHFFDDLSTMPHLLDPQARAKQVEIYDRFLQRLTRPSRAKHPPFAPFFRFKAQHIALKKQLGAQSEARSMAVQALRSINAAEPHFTITNHPNYSDLGDIALAAQRLDLALGFFEKGLHQHHVLWDEAILVVKYLRLLPVGLALTAQSEDTLVASLTRVGLGSRAWDHTVPSLHASIPRLALKKNQPALGLAYLRGRERLVEANWGLSPAEFVYMDCFLTQLRRPVTHVTQKRLSLQPETWSAHERSAYALAMLEMQASLEGASGHRRSHNAWGALIF